MTQRTGRAVIVGSAFDAEPPAGLELAEEAVHTPFGEALLHRVVGADGAWLLFRHGLPHRLLPNQIPYRANAAALAQVGVGALLVTSSVGVMDPELPLFRPMLLCDLLMLDNRLPDGSACTIFTTPSGDAGHLVLNEGLFSSALGDVVHDICREEDIALGPKAIFAYAQGPRTKTAAENRFLAAVGAQVNSMTLAPEVVLANELEIATAGLVTGHKYSVPGRDNPDEGGIEASLVSARRATETVIRRFLERTDVVEFANHIYRFENRS